MEEELYNCNLGRGINGRGEANIELKNLKTNRCKRTKEKAGKRAGPYPCQSRSDPLLEEKLGPPPQREKRGFVQGRKTKL